MTEQKMKMKKELKKPELTAEEAVVHVQVCFNLSVGNAIYEAILILDVFIKMKFHLT